MSKRRRMRGGAALVLAALSLVVLGALSPAVGAQSNSPGNNQPTDSAPAPPSGGVSNESGTNTGGDGQAGNRTTPGQGGATGGGAGAPASSDSNGGISVGPFLLVLAVVAAIAAGIFVVTRQRRLERAGVS